MEVGIMMVQGARGLGNEVVLLLVIWSLLQGITRYRVGEAGKDQDAMIAGTSPIVSTIEVGALPWKN